MTYERELKLALEDRAALVGRLAAAGARRVRAETFEDNTVWDRDGSLRAASCLLRLRRDGNETRLTYKGAPRFERSVKVRVEHETTVGDFERAEAILRALGYAPVRRYQKYREHWQLDGVEIAVDRTPIGDFVEFEGDAASDVAARCGFDPRAALEADYLSLYDDYRRSHPDAPAEMVFAGAGPDDG